MVTARIYKYKWTALVSVSVPLQGQRCQHLGQQPASGSAHLCHSSLLHLVELPLHGVLVPLQPPLGVSQPLQVSLVLLLLPLYLLPLLLQLPLLLADLPLLQRTVMGRSSEKLHQVVTEVLV